MRKKHKILFVLLAAGMIAILAGCGMREYIEGFKTEILQEDAEIRERFGQREEDTERELKKETVQKTEMEDSQKEEPAQDGSQEEIQKEEFEKYKDNYAFQTLGDTAKKVYLEVLATVLDHQEKKAVSTKDDDLLEEVYRAVCADYGNLYWISGYSYTKYSRNGELTGMEFSPKYTMDRSRRDYLQQQIDTSAKEFLTGISVEDTEYEKAKHIFEALIQNVNYDASAENNQNIISVFLNHATVCQGYACAAQYLLRQMEIQSAVVTGYANGESHAWNLMRLDGEYYYMDVTWGNSRYLNQTSETENYVNYNYLAVTTEEIIKTHEITNSFPLPVCSSMKDNYFVRENRYFTEWNPDAIGGVLAEAWNEKKSQAAVKFSSPELYGQARNYFITEQHIADYCQNMDSIFYLEDDELFVLTFRY